MKTKQNLLRIFATIAVLASFFAVQPALWAKEKMQQCMIKDGKVMTMKGQMLTGCVLMKDGKMVAIENGVLKPLKKNLTLPDGTKCLVNGVCVMKSGDKMQLKEGQGMGPTGIFEVKGLTLHKN